MRHLVTACLLLLCAGLASPAFAHELQPSSLELRQLTTERFEVIWRAPVYYKKPHPAQLQLPGTWKILAEPSITQLPDAALHRQLVEVPDGAIDGAKIRFNGLEATITDVFARFKWLDGTETTAIARPSQPWVEVDAQQSAWQVARDYTLLGIDHILSGFDHLTFVLALLLIVNGARRLLITVTSFTLAHSITLAAATLGLMWVPGSPVEAVIALSILFLASELVKVNRSESSLTANYPWIVAFVFGLLHGFGFAGALGDIGLPQNEVPLALLMFNVGVEIGQLLFIAFILAMVLVLRRLRRNWPDWIRQVPAYGIGSIAAFWLIERVAGF
ncbi:MAG: HupE/UreJ family protein [Gammaproteobacteria bacterium]|nr:HupE/UreJ family protein [Gammaproteobacteria bacterium]